MAHVNVLHGAGMSDDEIDAFLLEQGIGVLALADGGDAYAVPLSFGYDGEDRLYFDLIRFGEGSRKTEFAEATETGCFLTYDVRSQFDWRSVVASGPIDPVPEDEAERMDEAMTDNAWFPSLFPPNEPMTGVRRFKLEIEHVTGRQGADRQ